METDLVGFTDIEQAVHVDVEGLAGSCINIDVLQVSTKCNKNF